MTLGQTLFLVVLAAIGMAVAIKESARLQNFDPVVWKAPGNIVIVKGDVQEKPLKSILVSLLGNMSDALAIAERILPPEGGRITTLYSNRAKRRPGHIHNILQNIVTNDKIPMVLVKTNSRLRRFAKRLM